MRLRSARHIFIGMGIALIIYFVPFPGISPSAHRVLAIAILMAYWWISEAIPLAVTALLPVVFFPLLGVLSAKEATRPYAEETIFLLLGGFLIAQAIEKQGLHRRMALFLTSILGENPRRLILSLMIATALISLWISNSATTLMMLPLGMSLVERRMGEGTQKALLLGIAYAASIGGVGTLVGTPTNLIFAGQAKQLLNVEISFYQWMKIGLPAALLFLPIAWFLLTFLVFRVPTKHEGWFKEEVERERVALGRMTEEEKWVLGVFVSVALLWITRSDIGFFPGWAKLLGLQKWVGDSTVAMLGALALFLIPLNHGKRILTWEAAQKIPWGVILLMGGGFALAEGFVTSGLSQWFAEGLKIFSGLPLWAMVVMVSLVATFLTEFASNMATASILLPILAALAQGTGINPLLLMIPATLSASFGFVLPVGTPPNAMIFGSGKVKVKDMARAGIWLDLAGVLIVSLLTCVWVRTLLN